MLLIQKINKAYIRTYRDNGQTTAYVEWINIAGANGRTEGAPNSAHMLALLQRAERDGLTIEREVW